MLRAQATEVSPHLRETFRKGLVPWKAEFGLAKRHPFPISARTMPRDIPLHHPSKLHILTSRQKLQVSPSKSNSDVVDTGWGYKSGKAEMGVWEVG